MGKIFVVTAGDYDDYHIIGVTTDKAVAERLVELYDDDYDTPFIEEHDDTQMQDIENVKPAWYVTIWDNGHAETDKSGLPYDPDYYNETVTKFSNHIDCIVPGNTREEAIEEAKKRRNEYDSNN